MNFKSISYTTIIISLCLLIASLTQTCFCTNTCGSSVIVFFMGWAGILMDLGAFFSDIADLVQGKGSGQMTPIGACFSWLANPLILLTYFALISEYKTAFYLSLASTLFSLSFLFFDKILDNEAGHYNEIKSYQLGYWLWLGVSLVNLIGSVILIKLNKATTTVS